MYTLLLAIVCNKNTLWCLNTHHNYIFRSPRNVVGFELLDRCWFKSNQGLWITSCEESIELFNGTSVVQIRSTAVVPYIIYRGAPNQCLCDLIPNKQTRFSRSKESFPTILSRNNLLFYVHTLMSSLCVLSCRKRLLNTMPCFISKIAAVKLCKVIYHTYKWLTSF